MKKIAICLTFVMLCLTGCGTTDQMDANQSESQQANAKSGSDQAVLNEYNNLIFGKDADGKAIASFIKNNANVVSEEASSQMVLQFEEFQKTSCHCLRTSLTPAPCKRNSWSCICKEGT